jgi:hypothetical protein
MRLMHTKLPDFYEKVINAGKKLRPETEVEIRGLESFKTGQDLQLNVSCKAFFRSIKVQAPEYGHSVKFLKLILHQNAGRG